MRRRSLALSLPLLVLSIACGPTSTGGPSGNDDAGPPAALTCTVDGVELRKPLERARTQAGNAPDLSCVDDPAQLSAGREVTVQGCVEIFGLGGKAKVGLKIAFFDATQDPTSAAPAYGETEILTKTGGSPEAADCPKEGWYSIEGVPTNRQLIIKVYEDQGPSQTAIPTYTYFEHLPDENVVDGVVEYEANLIYASTYSTIPTLGGQLVDGSQVIYDGVGRGVIAGEVHDCNGELVQGASLSTTRFDSSTQVAYFDGNDEDPKPDLAVQSTNFDALYVVLNAKTAPATNDHGVVAAVLDPACTADDPADCECVKAGGATVRVFPDSVTLLSPDGTFPLSAE